jgi:ubiquinone/menaquinone biosynthesis C-methylase UbiE
VVDAVIASNILFQLEEKEKFLEETKRILKPGGRILLVEWIPDPSPIGPRMERALSQKKAAELFEKIGFKRERDLIAGQHHYGMIWIR